MTKQKELNNIDWIIKQLKNLKEKNIDVDAFALVLVTDSQVGEKDIMTLQEASNGYELVGALETAKQNMIDQILKDKL